MSMEINGSGGYSRINFSERLNAEEIKKEQREENISKQTPVQHDEYISSEKSGEKPKGIYRVGQDENGKRKIFFDDPKKSDKAAGKEHSQVKTDQPDKQEEKCVGNTDKVEREIRKLKEEKQQLEQQIKVDSGDEEKVRKLEKKLAQVESELRQKDNDTYRRQNSSFTNL